MDQVGGVAGIALSQASPAAVIRAPTRVRFLVPKTGTSERQTNEPTTERSVSGTSEAPARSAL
jgi:hypothetical protein